MTDDKPILVLGVSGGIAAYKAANVLKLLRDEVDAHVVMTEAATRFVGPVTFAALTGHPVLTDLFDDSASGQPRHITMTDRARCLAIVPATADVIGKLANGIADDPLLTVAISVACPIVIAPAMNTRMWEHPLVARNIATLRGFGAHIVDPESGWLADGHEGPGRLADESVIADAIRAAIRGDFGPLRAPTAPRLS